MEIDLLLTQDTLDSLRIVRRRLYAIPENELGAMSLQDQLKYAADLHQTGLAILKLETAKLKGINAAFKAQENQLQQAAARVEADATALADAVKMIRAVSEGLALVTNLVELLG